LRARAHAVTPAKAGVRYSGRGGNWIPTFAEMTSAWAQSVMRAAALCLAILFLFTLPAFAQAERIDSFSSDVTLRPDGTVEVIETIDIVSAGQAIRRGIVRDIPFTLRNDDGSLLRSDLSVISVTRDGNPEAFARESLSADIARIRIGSADVLLNNGRHRYEIRYTMSRMARRFADHDELFWNATGNYWDFPILAAVSRVSLPARWSIDGTIGYTGAPGSTEQGVTITRPAANIAVFRADRGLASGEGMSVAVRFAKGLLTEPEGAQGAYYWLSDRRDIILPVLAVILVLGYNLLAWSAVGRDPKKGTIFPRFHPPTGYSPALVHYIANWGWARSGWTAFTAAIFNLGVKGLVAIDNTDKVLTISHRGKAPAEPLPPGEAAINEFLTGKGRVTVNRTDGPELAKAKAEFTRRIEGENRQVYFRHNFGYVLLGIVISIACLALMLWLGVLDPEYMFLAIAAGVGVGMLTGLLRAFWAGNGIGRIILIAWALIFGGNLAGAFSGAFQNLSIDPPLVATASIVLINVAFAILMRAPTVQGRARMDEIDGLKMYLETAEKNRLNMDKEPPMTIERFERLLPYAIALGVEKPWSEHFAAALARNEVTDAPRDYAPAWYRGGGFSSGSTGFSNAVSAMATGMSAAMISAQPASSSSSGFSGGGGGGGSGGGGGGGGGGGW
jgi:hypothetical protein